MTSISTIEAEDGWLTFSTMYTINRTEPLEPPTIGQTEWCSALCVLTLKKKMQILRKDTKVSEDAFTNRMTCFTMTLTCLEPLKLKDLTVSDLLQITKMTGTLMEAAGLMNTLIQYFGEAQVNSDSFQSPLMSMQTAERILESEKKPLTLSATLDKQIPLTQVTFSRKTYLSLTSQPTNPEEPTFHASKLPLLDSLQASAFLLHWLLNFKNLRN